MSREICSLPEKQAGNIDDDFCGGEKRDQTFDMSKPKLPVLLENATINFMECLESALSVGVIFLLILIFAIASLTKIEESSPVPKTCQRRC